MVYIGIFIIAVFCSSCSQILLKHATLKQYRGMRNYLNLEVFTAYCIFLLMLFITTIMYKYIPLSTGMVLDSLGYIFVLTLSAIILKEKIRKEQIKGMILIILGIAICCLA